MKTKILLSLYFFIFFTFNFQANDQAEYKVHSVVGKVSRQSGAGWTSLKRQDTLFYDSKIMINPESSIKLIDSKSNMVFSFSSPGEYPLPLLVSNAQKESSSLLKKISSEAKKQIAKNNSRTHKTIGASKRATLDEETLESLYATLVEKLSSREQQGELNLIKHPLPENLSILEIINNSKDKYLYFNVFIKTGDSYWHTIMPTDEDQCSIMLAPGENILLEHIPFYDDDNINIAAVGLEQDFDGDELSDMFEENLDPVAGGLDNVNIAFIK